jgi:ribosomal RNA-processing protein 17
MADEKAKKERRDERKERREEMRRTLGISGDAPEGEEIEAVVAGAVDTEVVEYGSGVTVTVEGID